VSIVAPIVEGRALSDVLRSQGHIPPPEAARIVAVLAEALHLVHELGLVHGDIYPSNVFLGIDGHVALAGWKTALRSTSAGAGLRPAFGAPERLRDLGTAANPRSDIYSLGVLLYALLTGERPFQGKDLRELIENVLTTTAKPPRRIVRSIPAPLEAICLKAMARKPDDRYATAGELAAALRDILQPRTRRGFWK
jgi:serine/threonine protein kinase